ncbi:MAG: TfoX/Sxy family protein [Burkholderiaceae bacterium]
MPARPNPFVEHCVELFACTGTVRARRMFGGTGLDVEGIFLALVAGETLYLKTDDATRAAFQNAGCRPFQFQVRDKQVVTGYWSAPEAALESAGQMQPWARLALEAALRARAAKPASPRRRTAAAATASEASPRKPAAKTSARRSRTAK